MRLEQGDMARATVFHRDPAAQARAFELAGFEYLHIVDLDGAFAGKPVNADAVDRILETIGIPVQLGGGVRDMATVEGWLGKGVDRVIIGTAAVRDPALVKQTRPRNFPAASRSGSTPATARWRCKAGRKLRNSRRSRSRAASRTPAFRPSSIPTSRATACSRVSISTPPSRWPTRSRFR